MGNDHKTLKDFLNLLQKKRKSLRNRFSNVEIFSKISEKNCENDYIEIEFRKKKSYKSRIISVKVWKDRWILVDAREYSGSGWLWSLNIDGRISGIYDFSSVIECIELMDDALSGDVSEVLLNKIRAIWNRILVKGPIGRV